jgi:hypothetical protein
MASGVRPGATHGKAAPLWDSYNVAIAPVSKTYACRGTSQPCKESDGLRGLASSIHRVRVPRRRSCRRPDTPTKEHLMLDILMLALGLSFFAVSIGYAYACERL